MPDPQNWFSTNAPVAAMPPVTAGSDWFAERAPVQQAAPIPVVPRKGFTFEGLGRGLLDTAEGAADFLNTAVRASVFGGSDLNAINKLGQGVKQQIASDVQGFKADPSVVGKVGRAAAMPVDLLGVPATGIANDIIAGDYGHAAGTALGTAALMKVPQAALRVRGRMIPAGEPAVPVLSADLPAPAEGASWFARHAPTEPLPSADLPPEFQPVGSDPHARIADLPAGNKPGYAKVPFPVADEATQTRLPQTVDYGQPKIERIPVDSLVATQPTITRDVALEKLARGPQDISELPVGANSRPSADLPVVFKGADGQNYLAGGTHEAVAAWARGDSTLQAITYPEMGADVAPGSDVITRVQSKLAAGEPLGTPDLRASFAERQRVQAARASETAPNLSPDESMYREVRDDARSTGYTGTDAQLRSEFTTRLAQARRLLDSTNAPGDNYPQALLQAIAEGGGLRLNDPVFGGELAGLAENSRSFAVGNGGARSGSVKASHAMPRMELGGVPSVLRNDGSGLSLDGMVEYLRQDPQFRPHIEDINDLLSAVEDSARTAPTVERVRLADALQAVGVRAGTPWWAESGTASRGVRSVGEGFSEPPADWFTKNAPGAEASSRVAEARRLSREDFIAKRGTASPGELGNPLSEVMETGAPGIRVEPMEKPRLLDQPVEPHPYDKSVVFRDDTGAARGVLRLNLDANGTPDVPQVWVDPAFRRQGIATGLYDAAARAGYELPESGQRLTPEGAALFHSRAMREMGAPAAGEWFAANSPDAGLSASADDFDFGANAPPGGEPPSSSGGSGGPGGGDEIPPARPLSPLSVRDEQFLGKLPEDVQPTLRRVWQEYQGFGDQRREVQPLARTQALADRTTLPESIAPGTALNAEQMTAAYDQLIAREREFQQLAPKVADGTATDAEWLRHRELETERVLAAERVRGAVAESGRSMRAIRAKVEELKAIQVAQQSHDPSVLQQARSAIGRGAVSNFLRTYIYGNLLSGVPTMERSFTSQSLQLANDILADVVTGKPRRAGAMVVGALAGLPRGLAEFAHVMRNGGMGDGPLDAGARSRELPGGALNPWNDVLRIHSATFRLSRAISTQAELSRRGWVEAGAGANRVARAATLIAEHPEWNAEANRISDSRVFQDRTGKIANAVIALRETVPGGFLIAPFIRVSSNLVKMGVANSPIPFALDLANRITGTNFEMGQALRAPGRLGELARARASYGSLVLAGLLPYALSGNVTGDGPRDPARRTLWMETHQPNSIKIGGTWVSLHTWPGVGLALQALANGVETAKDMRQSGKPLTEDGGLQLVANVLARTVNSITSQSFLQGVEDFQNALSDPARYAARAVTNTVTEFQPLQALSRTAARVVDRTVRAPNNLTEALQANTPGLSTRVPPMLDPFGEPVVRTQSPLTVGFAQVQTPSTDPLVLKLESLNMGQSRPTGRITLPPEMARAGMTATLSRDQQIQLAQARGRAWRGSEQALMQVPGFDSLPADIQKALLEGARTAAGARVTAPAKAGLMRDALMRALSGGGR